MGFGAVVGGAQWESKEEKVSSGSGTVSSGVQGALGMRLSQGPGGHWCPVSRHQHWESQSPLLSRAPGQTVARFGSRMNRGVREGAATHAEGRPVLRCLREGTETPAPMSDGARLNRAHAQPWPPAFIISGTVIIAIN